MKFQRNSQVFSRLIEGEWILLKQNSTYYYRLNETAGFLWEKLGKQKTPEDLLKSIASTYKVEKTQVKKDVDNFLKSGLKYGFILLKN